VISSDIFTVGVHQMPTEMMRVRPETLKAADLLADTDDVERTRVAAAAIDALRALPVSKRRKLYAIHQRRRGRRCVTPLSGAVSGGGVGERAASEPSN
jgi:hypothetical protein